MTRKVNPVIYYSKQDIDYLLDLIKMLENRIIDLEREIQSLNGVQRLVQDPFSDRYYWEHG